MLKKLNKFVSTHNVYVYNLKPLVSFSTVIPIIIEFFWDWNEHFHFQSFFASQIRKKNSQSIWKFRMKGPFKHPNHVFFLLNRNKLSFFFSHSFSLVRYGFFCIFPPYFWCVPFYSVSFRFVSDIIFRIDFFYLLQYYLTNYCCIGSFQV